MATDNGNDDGLPFASCDLSLDLSSTVSLQTTKDNTRRRKKKYKKNYCQLGIVIDNEGKKMLSSIYFEYEQNDNNRLAFIAYGGPCNPLHINRQLYLTRLLDSKTTDSNIAQHRLTTDYDRTIRTMTALSSEMTLSIFLRFGISYVMSVDTGAYKTMSTNEFIAARDQGLHVEYSTMIMILYVNSRKEISDSILFE
jgi:hypothetical protein